MISYRYEVSAFYLTPYQERIPPSSAIMQVIDRVTMLAQAILYRGARLSVVWQQFIALVVIGIALFSFSLARFRKTIGTMV